MRILSYRAIREFSAKYTDCAKALDNWYRIAKKAHWQSGADVKAELPDSDAVGDKTVFNIVLNRYRLIAHLNFRHQTLYIKAILTHRQYDKGDWK